MTMRRLLLFATTAVVLPLGACVTDKDVDKLQNVFTATGARPDTMPVMNNRELPFRYPSALYAQKVQGNVTLRIFIDSTGRVHPESTLVVEPSGAVAPAAARFRAWLGPCATTTRRGWSSWRRARSRGRGARCR